MEHPREFSPAAPRPVRRAVLEAAMGAMYRAGVASAFARLRPRVLATILTYHSVPGPEEAPWIDPCNAMAPATFERHMQFLAERRRVISLTELLRELRAGVDPRPGTVVITFDDGYRDTLEVAAPILARLGLPATLYLPTALVTREESPWINRLYTAVRWRQRDELVWDAGSQHRFGGNGDGRQVYRECVLRLIGSTAVERERILSGIESQLQPARCAPRQTLNWPEVRCLRDRYPLFELGVHTANHLDLTSCGEAVARDEIGRCIEEARRELGAAPAHFAFPYSRSSPETRRLVAEAGLVSGVIDADDPVVRPGTDPWALPRVIGPASLSLLGMVTSGAYPDLPRLVFRRR